MTQAMRIGIVGQMMSGKTSLANALISKYGMCRMALADAVKNDCIEALNHVAAKRDPDFFLTRASLEENKEVFRPFLQWYGTEFGREFVGPDSIWIDDLIARVNEHQSRTGQVVICDDVRFENEVEHLRDAGFVFFRIERASDTHTGALFDKYGVDKTAQLLSHPSESAVLHLPVDYVIHNPGSHPAQIDQLAVSVMAVMEDRAEAVRVG